LLNYYNYPVDYARSVQKINKLELLVYQITDAYNMFVYLVKKRGIVGSLVFNLNYFLTSGNRKL